VEDVGASGKEKSARELILAFHVQLETKKKAALIRRTGDGEKEII
jgi:hypothetical protein